MLSAPNRLRNEKDILRVIKTGRYAAGPNLMVRAAHGGNETRATVVAGLKVHKKSTLRNLVKRRLREAAREILKEIVPGYDIVITARAEAVGKNYQDLGNELYGLLGRLGLINSKKKPKI